MTKTEAKPIFVRPHLGMGDFLVCNSIFRHFAESNGIILPCKSANLPSVQFMLNGLTVAFLAVTNDEQVDRFTGIASMRGTEILKLGMFGEGFDGKRWDAAMFEQAGLPFEQRWTGFKVDRDLSREFEPPKEPYAFVHEDVQRGFVIRLARVPKDIKLVYPVIGQTNNLFDYCRLIENATELHLIDSCFAILADSLPSLKCKRFVVHHYARNGLMPTYRFPVEILR